MLQFTNFKGLKWSEFSQNELGGPWEALWAREILQGPRTGIVDSEEFTNRRVSMYNSIDDTKRQYVEVFIPKHKPLYLFSGSTSYSNAII